MQDRTKKAAVFTLRQALALGFAYAGGRLVEVGRRHELARGEAIARSAARHPSARVPGVTIENDPPTRAAHDFRATPSRPVQGGYTRKVRDNPQA